MDREKYLSQQRIAWSLLTRHDHPTPTSEPLTRENCGACVLNGYHAKGEPRDDINYAGWARIYIQAGRAIPKNLHMAFLAELASTNRAYADALIEDIRNYGINTNDMKFKRHIQNIMGIYDTDLKS